MTPRHVAVVGYGTGGQGVALMLARDGHRVEVFERAPAPGPVGAGFLLQPVGLAVLWELGLLEAALAHGAPVARLHGETVAGRAVMDMRYAELEPRLYGLGLQRGALFELLDAALVSAFGALDEIEAAAERRRAAEQQLGELSPRELEVMAILVEGASNKLVAHRLALSIRTVEMHRKNALAKLGVRSIAEVIALAATANRRLTK